MGVRENRHDVFLGEGLVGGGLQNRGQAADCDNLKNGASGKESRNSYPDSPASTRQRVLILHPVPEVKNPLRRRDGSANGLFFVQESPGTVADEMNRSVAL